MSMLWPTTVSIFMRINLRYVFLVLAGHRLAACYFTFEHLFCTPKTYQHAFGEQNSTRSTLRLERNYMPVHCPEMITYVNVRRWAAGILLSLAKPHSEWDILTIGWAPHWLERVQLKCSIDWNNVENGWWIMNMNGWWRHTGECCGSFRNCWASQSNAIRLHRIQWTMQFS